MDPGIGGRQELLVPLRPDLAGLPAWGFAFRARVPMSYRVGGNVR
jgi:hypothetical protein